jgi:hypothetical protein
VALEYGRVLDETILPEFETWDIRRYGNTRIAIKVLSGDRAVGGSGASLEPASSGEARADPEGDHEG